MVLFAINFTIDLKMEISETSLYSTDILINIDQHRSIQYLYSCLTIIYDCIKEGRSQVTAAVNVDESERLLRPRTFLGRKNKSSGLFCIIYMESGRTGPAPTHVSALSPPCVT